MHTYMHACARAHTHTHTHTHICTHSHRTHTYICTHSHIIHTSTNTQHTNAHTLSHACTRTHTLKIPTSRSLTRAKFSACRKSSVSARTIGCCMELDSSSLAVTLLYRFHRGRSRLRSMAGRGGGLGSSGGGRLSGCRVVSEEAADLLLGRHSFCVVMMRSRSWMALRRWVAVCLHATQARLLQMSLSGRDLAEQNTM